MNYAQFLPLLELTLSETVAQKTRLRENVKLINSDIMARAKALHDAVDRAYGTLFKWTGSMMCKELKRLDAHEEDLLNIINRVTDDGGDEHYNNQVSESSGKNKRNTTHGKDGVYPEIHRLTEFQYVSLNFSVSQPLNDEFMKELCGSIQIYQITPPSTILKNRRSTVPNIRLSLVAEFSCQGQGPSANVHAVAPISDTEAWLCCGWGSKEIDLYHTSGEKKVTVKLDISVNDIVLTKSGDLLVSSYNGQTIKRVDQRLKVSTFADLTFFSRGMALTDDDCVYVCGTERKGSSGTTPTPEDNRRNVIAKFSLDGSLVSELAISPHDAHRITLTVDNKICFSDYEKSNKRQIMLMDENGLELCKYAGPPQHDQESPFYPLDLTCDHYGHIIVSDWNNDCVHLMNKNAEFLQFLIDKGEGIQNPNALAIDREGRLWVGNATGVIRVYDYFSW